MKPKLKQNAGFSLIELLFAIVFLTIVVVGVMKLQTSHLVIGNTQQNQLRAHFYVSQALEVAEALGPVALENCANPCYLSQNGGSYSVSNTVETLDEGLFERSLSTSQEGLMSKDAYVVSAEVTWTDSAGAHSVAAKRVIFD